MENMKKEINMKSLGSAFRTYLFILEAYVDAVEQLYHSNNANDIKSYQGIILRRIVNSLKTLDQVLVFSKDPISGYSLLRTIVDSICAYCFIYDNDNNDEMEFRHYLYLLDGCSQFVNAFPLTLKNNELIEKSEEGKISNELDQEKTNLVVFHNNLFDYLFNSNIVCHSKSEADIIIKRHDWKYRTILHYSEKESYNWRDIYDKVGCDSFMVNFFSTFLSQYVHGLFLSNTKNPNTSVHYSLIYDIVTSLEKRLILAILQCFKEDNIRKRILHHIDLDKMRESDIDIENILSFLNRKP